MNNFTIWMRRKQFIPDICKDMEKHCDPEISPGFTIEPVNQKDKNDCRASEIESIDSSFCDEITMIIAIYSCKWEMPSNPIDRKH